MRVAVKRLSRDARLPEYATSGAAAMDLRACVEESLPVGPGMGTLVPTGLAFAIPAGHVGLIRDRSGLAVAGLITVAGVIDSDYRGEVKVAVRNVGQVGIEIHPGDRVAQMLVIPCVKVDLEELDELPPTARGEGGFGSTGLS